MQSVAKSFGVNEEWEYSIVSEPEQPERELMAAMIRRAVLDLHNRGRHNNIWRDSAYWWLFEEEDPEGERDFSFQYCCNNLGLDIAAMREKVGGRLITGMEGYFNQSEI
jgi:hypothetical protein